MERRLRLWSGLVIVLFVVGHTTNLALGLLSLEAMEWMRRPFAAVWQTPPMTLLLYGSIATHVVLALAALYRRSHLRMHRWEAAQVLLGLGIPALLLVHAVPARLADEILDAEVTHEAVVGLLIFDGGWERQAAMVVVIWLHLAVGLHFWLRLKPWYPRALPLLYPAALLLPLLGLLGFWRAGLDVLARDAADPGYRAELFAAYAAATPEQIETIYGVGPILIGVFAGTLGLVLLARLVRRAWRTRHGRFRVAHPAGRPVAAPVGQTLLEAIRGAGLPHAAVCGGRGRCTTCRVRVGAGFDDLPPADAIERKALDRIAAPPPVRLACQVRPRRDLSVTPLVDPAADAMTARRPGGVSGREQAVAALFCDLRGSTALGERRLPYDVVFILNRFFAEMAEALAETDGHYAQFAGDGLMALYGLDRGVEQGCRDAARGAVRMLQRLEAINRALVDELDEPLRMGIGIHAGEAIVGTMGPPASPIVSAVGDTINIAARLEAQTKTLGVPLLISLDAARQSGLGFEGFPIEPVPVRGRRGSIDVLAIDRPDAITGLDPLPALAVLQAPTSGTTPLRV